MDTRFSAFVAVAALLIVAPGPDMALVTRTVLARGWPSASLTALGVGAGSFCWGLFSALGISALVATSTVAFTFLKVAGDAYLLYLGLSILLSRPSNEACQELKPTAAFGQGLLNNLLNPKAAAIFLTVFPQFVRPGDPALRLLLMLAAFEAMLLIWLNFYSAAMAWVARSHLQPALGRLSERLTGVVLVGLGVRLVLEHR